MLVLGLSFLPAFGIGSDRIRHPRRGFTFVDKTLTNVNALRSKQNPQKALKNAGTTPKNAHFRSPALSRCPNSRLIA
jgi:hypothetical protein